MTEKEHADKTRALKCKITRLRNKMKASGLLATKIDLERQRKEVEKELDEHRHNYYSLTRH